MSDPIPPRYLTDPALLKKRAGDLADQTMAFRTWVKYRCDLTAPEIDALVAATADEVWQGISCIDCGQCCRVLTGVGVDENDIARLARVTGLTAAEFRKRHIRREDGELFLAAKPCPFLNRNACTVYTDRPKACRDFPYLHSPGFSGRMLMMLENTFICPIVFHTMEALKRRLPWRRKRKRGDPPPTAGTEPPRAESS